MPSALRAQVALVGLFAVLLIPIGTSSLRGLTHVLSCQERSQAPFALQVDEDGRAVISSSQVIERPGRGAAPPGELCGGLRLDLAVGAQGDGHADIDITIHNGTDYGWHGSVELSVDGTDIPVGIGRIDPHGSAQDTVELRLRDGRRYELAGSLLVGP
ncbi:MAG: hypothetical protein AB7L84_10635 [Acidimicrobiia bacterium]